MLFREPNYRDPLWRYAWDRAWQDHWTHRTTVGKALCFCFALLPIIAIVVPIWRALTFVDYLRSLTLKPEHRAKFLKDRE